MEKPFTIDTYAVMGNPIAHSKSPIIHQEFAKQTGQTLEYLKILVPFDGFVAAVKDFQQRGGKGLNITVPFKLPAYNFVSELSARAKLVEAVNTIIFKNDKIYGDNTDGIGFIRDITINQKFPIINKNILIIGAGGAAQGIIAPILAEKPKLLVIANRTPEKAVLLETKFSKLGPITHKTFNELNSCYDLIINATSASLAGEIPALSNKIINENSFCYDLAYAAELTPFLQWAKQNQAAHAVDGLGMLVEQAAESFYLWRGIKPETQPVIALLHNFK